MSAREGLGSRQGTSFVLATLAHHARAPAASRDAVTIFDAFAYFAELIDAQANATRADAIPAAIYDEAQDLITIRVGGTLGGVTVLLAGRERAYVIIAGPQAGESILVFGDGIEGARPADARDSVRLTYGSGAGESGNISISGLGLAGPMVLVAVADGCARPLYVRLDVGDDVASEASACSPTTSRGDASSRNDPAS
jgi:hypothetical protein